MKKFTFFCIIPTLFLTTTTCSAMELTKVSLTQSQRDHYFPNNDWILVSHTKTKKYSMTAERPYYGAIVAKLSYQPMQNRITLQYSDTQTNRVYASSSFDLPEQHNAPSICKLNFTFIDDKTKAIIALGDTDFILPVPFKVMRDTPVIQQLLETYK